MTSVVGALTFVVLAMFEDGSVVPVWSTGLACGAGGTLYLVQAALCAVQLPPVRVAEPLGRATRTRRFW